MKFVSIHRKQRSANAQLDRLRHVVMFCVTPYVFQAATKEAGVTAVCAVQLTLDEENRQIDFLGVLG